MKIVISILLTLLFVVACEQADDVQKTSSAESIGEKFAWCLSKRDFVCVKEIINFISTKEDRNSFNKVAYEFWIKDCTFLHNENCDVLEDVDVRLSIASYLAQEIKNGFLDGEIQEYIDYSIDVYLHSRDISSRAKAIRLIGVIGFSGSLNYIEDALMSNNELLAESGGLAYSMNCSVEDRDFESMLGKITNNNAKSRLKNNWNAMRSIRQFCKKQ